MHHVLLCIVYNELVCTVYYVRNIIMCYEQRVGAMHGDEQPYLWGAPLEPTLSFFPSNYTLQDVEISQAIMSYWTNFARSG